MSNIFKTRFEMYIIRLLSKQSHICFDILGGQNKQKATHTYYIARIKNF